MNITLIVRYIHFISILIVFATLVFEYLMLANQLDRKTIGKISRVDGIYGVFAIVIVGAGLTLWLWVGKPAEFYNANGIIYIKLGLFSLVGILSIWPTIFFLKQRKGDENEMVEIPPLIKKLVLAEIILMLLIPALAVMMANGVNLF